MISSRVLLLILILVTTCKKENSGDHFPEALQKVWQDNESISHGDNVGIYFTDTEIILWDYAGDDFDNGDECYYEVVLGKLNSFDGNAFRIFMYESLFTGREDIEETLYIFNNNNWISIYEESDVEEDRIWIEDNRSRKDIEPLCGEE